MNREEKVKIITDYCRSKRQCIGCKIRNEKYCNIYSLEDMSEDVLDECLKFIGISVFEHDGCVDCKHDLHNDSTEEPCCICKGTKSVGSPEYNDAPDLWEPIEHEESDDQKIKERLEKIKNEPVQVLPPDNVNHPKHYADSCSLECIQVMELMFGKTAVIHFCLLNAFKYVWRFKNKNGKEDLKKAEWYLKKCENVIKTGKYDGLTLRGQIKRLKYLLKELNGGD